MNTQSRLFSVLLTLIFLSILVLPGVADTYPTVSLNFFIPPNIRTIRIGEIQEIVMVARAEGQNLKFKWNIDGPGHFKGDTNTPAVSYIPPNKIGGETAEATITVTVIDEKGKKATDNVTFTLLAPSALIVLPIPDPTLTRIDYQVFLKNASGTIIKPTYFVEPGEIMIIDVNIAIPSNHNKVDCTAIFGKVKFRQQGILYIAPKKPGGSDIVSITAVDNDTGKTIVQESINITILDKQ